MNDAISTDASTVDTWTPHERYDLLDGDGASFAATLAKFRVWAKEQPRKPLNLTTGWHTLSGEVVEQMLIRNANNRDVRYPTVLQYGTSLANKRWKKTGEPIIITDRDEVEDGQHRLLASYFTGVPLATFVVANVPYEKDLFAYIDNSVPRTGEDALKIAGLNGLSKHLAAVIKDWAIRYDEGMICYAGRLPMNPITNVDILDYARAHPDLSDAAHIVKDMYAVQADRLQDSKIATFVSWKILQHHGQNVLEDFMSALMNDNLPSTHPVTVLRRRLEEHEAAKDAPKRSAKKKQLLTPPKILALTIKAFNLMQSGTSARRLDPRADDPYPQFQDANPIAEAAQ
jgi:hypothetical protein